MRGGSISRFFFNKKSNMKELVFKGESNQVLTNSLLVAEKFGKEHSDVLKAIDALVSKMPKNQCEGYFADTSIEVKQPNGGVRHSRIVVMNRDGFTLLVMGFTGEKALQFKIEYINAFNKMEEALKAAAFNVPKSFREALLLAAEQQAQIEQQQMRIEEMKHILLAETEGHKSYGICHCLKDRNRTYHGYKWMYLSDYETLINKSKNDLLSQ